MPIERQPPPHMTPVRQKFCDAIRKAYVDKYKEPCPVSDTRILKLGLDYRFTRPDHPDIEFLLSDIKEESYHHANIPTSHE